MTYPKVRLFNESTRFIQLFDPSFKPTLTPSILLKIENAIRKLSISGSAEDLRQLLELVEEKTMKSDRTEGKLFVWQEELREYLALEFEPFDSEYLRSTVTASFEEIPWVQSLEQAPLKIEKLKQLLLENPYGVAKAIAYANEAALNQQKLLYKSYLALNQGIRVLSALNQFSTSQLLLWNETLHNTIVRESKMEWIALPYSESLNSVTLTTITPLLHGTALQKLCSDPMVEYSVVAGELNHLSRTKKGEKNIQKILNTAKDATKRPLHLAILARRADIVELLLSFDAKVESEDISIIDEDISDDISQYIAALLEFYQNLQRFDSNDEIKPGRTLSLIKQGIKDQPPKEEHFENVTMFFGYTGTGKSSFINSLDGIEYILTENGLKPKQGHVEKTPTSNSFGSETKYPIIIKTNDSLRVDMPGSGETAGTSYEIAAGVLVQKTSERINNVKLMVLVLDYYELINSRGIHFVNIFNMYGSIIGNSYNRINNVLFLINKKIDYSQTIAQYIEDINNPKHYEAVMEKLKKIPDELDLEENAEFVLKNIMKRNVLISSPLDPEFRSKFSEIESRANSMLIKDFNFYSYHRHVEGFKRLMCRLEEYVALNKAHYNSVSTAIAKEQADHISMVRDLLEEEFLTKVPYEKAMPPAETKRRDNLNEQLSNHNALKEKWLSELFNPMLEMIASYVNNSTIDRIGSLQVAQQFSLRMEVASNFLQEMQKISLDYISQCPSILKTAEVEIHADGSETRSSGSAGIPGVGAGKPNELLFIFHPDGTYEFSPKQHLVIVNSKVLPELRQFAGKTQPSCVYPWSHGLQYILPKTTHLTNGNSDGFLPMPFCSPEQTRIEIGFWKDSFLRLSNTDVTLQIGQTLGYAIQHSKLSFNFGVVDSFFHEMIKHCDLPVQAAETIYTGIHLSLLYYFYGLLAVGIQCFGKILKNTSLGISEQALKNAITFIAIASHLLLMEASSTESILYLIAPLLISYFSSNVGQKVGRETAKAIPRIYGEIRGFFNAVQPVTRTEQTTLLKNRI